MILVPFKPEHLRMLVLQDAQAWMQPMIEEADYADALVAAGPCWTLTDGETVAMCAGLVRMWETRAQAWSLMSAHAGRRMIRVVRIMKGLIDLQAERRIEAVVDEEFEQGHRLIRMLGFVKEGVMRAYLPDGGSVAMYARVR